MTYLDEITNISFLTERSKKVNKYNGKMVPSDINESLW